jgi:hypothetical protein
MSRNAIRKAIAIALALAQKAKGGVDEFMPEVKLGDGLPEDPIETAQELQILKAAGLISDYEGISRLHPDWTEEQIEEEILLIKGAQEQAAQAAQTNGRGASRLGALLNGAQGRSQGTQQTNEEDDSNTSNGSEPPAE